MKVYQIVVLENEVAGHGSYAAAAQVASTSAYTVKPFPLYTDKAKAEEVAAAAYKTYFVRASVLELEVL